VLDAINIYHGRPVPVGTWKGEAPANRSVYDSVVAAEFPHALADWDSAPEAAALYAQALAQEPDSSVVLVAGGPLHNVWELVRRDGALAARKVKKLVVVGGDYPTGKEFNFVAGIARDSLPNVVQEVLRLWPTPIEFHGFAAGAGILVGACLDTVPAGNPLRRVFEVRTGGLGVPDQGYDASALLYAVRGMAMNGSYPDYWSLVSQGHNQVEDDGSNAWMASPDAKQAYLVRNGAAADLASELDSLLCRPPGP
jgi:hypothetical protein